jgi:DNA-directed RNA polymerase subunit L
MQYFQRHDRHRAVNGLIEMIEDHSLYAELGKVLSNGQKFSYTYDFGSSTNLNLRVASEREGPLNPKDVIMLLARTIAPEFKCSVW